MKTILTGTIEILVSLTRLSQIINFDTPFNFGIIIYIYKNNPSIEWLTGIIVL